MTEKEEWRKVRGYDGYLVSDKGDKGDPGKDAVLPFTEEEVTALKALVAKN